MDKWPMRRRTSLPERSGVEEKVRWVEMLKSVTGWPDEQIVNIVSSGGKAFTDTMNYYFPKGWSTPSPGSVLKGMQGADWMPGAGTPSTTRTSDRTPDYARVPDATWPRTLSKVFTAPSRALGALPGIVQRGMSRSAPGEPGPLAGKIGTSAKSAFIRPGRVTDASS